MLQLLVDRRAVLVLTLLKRACEQPVREKRVGPARQIVQADQRQAVRGGGMCQTTGHAFDGAGAVLGRDVLAPADTLGRHGRVELERGEAPGEALRLVAELVQRSEPARRADIAPRSDDVGPEHDLDHACSPPVVESRAECCAAHRVTWMIARLRPE